MTAIPLTPESLDEADKWLASAKEAQNKGDYKKAAIDIERAYRLAPQAPRVWHAGAVLRMRQKDYKWALETLDMVHQAIPNAADPCYHAGICCMTMGEYRLAKGWLKRATRRYGKKHGAGAWQVLASVYAMLGEESASRNAYQRCVECDTETADDRFNQGLVHLLRGEYEQGFELYESRLELPGFQPHRRVDLPRWDGKAEGRVLVVSEQGIGDTIMMERYLSLIPDYCVSVQPELASWFSEREHPVRANNLSTKDEFYDFQIPMMSLPRIFGVIPPDNGLPVGWTQRKGYRHVPPRVGICWAGNKDHPNDKDRSLGLEQAYALTKSLKDCGISWVSLQVGNAEPDVESYTTRAFRPESFLATAELMETLDAVVSVDTAVLHLAATLGVPTIGLVPTAPEWRWGLTGDTTPFYPSMQIVRRKRTDAWPQAIQEAASRLKEML